LNFVYALNRAEQLFHFFGQDQKATKYHELAERIKKSVYENCFDKQKGILADTPLKQEYSQHTNIFGILTGTFPKDQTQEVMKHILEDTSLIQTTIYYKFYLFEALKLADMGDLYLDQLGPWRDMINEGLTTFEEGDYDDRSDCHAWGASPLYHFMSIVGGIPPVEQGFKKVEIKPAFGKLNEIKIKTPHPNGDLKINLVKIQNKIKGSVTLPENVEGTFIWKDKIIKLTPGDNPIDVN
jgi:alpha-L-rhamnosidase